MDFKRKCNICTIINSLSVIPFKLQYLIAMVFTYFKRAEYEIYEYTRMNFFVAL